MSFRAEKYPSQARNLQLCYCRSFVRQLADQDDDVLDSGLRRNDKEWNLDDNAMKQQQTKLKNIVVLYHNGCSDGFGGAWAAWQIFKNKATYVPVDHGRVMTDDLVDKEVYLIDLCFSIEVMRDLLAKNKKVIVLDHHISQRDAVGISTEHVYDNNRSGAMIAWQYFSPDAPIPKLLKHIQDIDLWKFKISHTRELMAALNEYPFEFRTWNKIAQEWEDKETIKKYIGDGKSILKYEDRIVDRLIRHAERVEFEGKTAYAVNSPILESEIGNWIVKHRKAIGIVWAYKGRDVRVSLRSDGKTDVSELAQRYGGGGHKASAGFAFDVQLAFPWVKHVPK